MEQNPPAPPEGGTKPPKGGEAWGIDFSVPKIKRKITNKERHAIVASRIRGTGQQQQQQSSQPQTQFLQTGESSSLRVGHMADSEDNRHLQIISVDGMADVSALIPRDLPTERRDLEQRLCFRIPRLLCVTKQYPKSCGISSLTSVWNYLYSRLGESLVGADRPPISQEEMMSILGFAPPFDAISWGPFTGNGTLIRWFHAMNRHFGVKGRAYTLYKPQGKARTSQTQEEALVELKKVLRNPNAAVVYHCHNHYMVPIGFQEIPRAQSDFYAKDVSSSDCDTTIFIGEVSRGRHDALYAKKWSEIMKDLMCRSPEFYNIRRPELGVQKRAPKSKNREETKSTIKETTTMIPAESETEIFASSSSPTQQEGAGPTGVPSCEVKVQSPSGVETETHVTDTSAGDATLSAPNEKEPAFSTIQKKKRKSGGGGGGNLHCLICFRSDEVEEHPERFEVPSSSSSSGREDSSSDSGSDEGETDGTLQIE